MTLRRATAVAVGLWVTSSLALAAPLGAQRLGTVADSLVRRGMVERAESLYYDDIRLRPHDPTARWNLGTFLIARGATRIGMTLVEEAVQFGFDSTRAADVLAPVYLRLGEYGKLIALPAARFTPADRERVRYLDVHPTRTIVPDSTIVVAYVPAGPARTVGTLTIRVDGRPIVASITASGEGITLAETNSNLRLMHTFSAKAKLASGAIPSVADSVGFGQLSIVNMPVLLVPLQKGIEAEVPVRFLARFTPTFNPRAARLTLHTSDAGVRPPRTASVFLTLDSNGQLMVRRAGGWISLADPQLSRMLGEQRWTLDERRGTLAVEP